MDKSYNTYYQSKRCCTKGTTGHTGATGATGDKGDKGDAGDAGTLTTYQLSNDSTAVALSRNRNLSQSRNLSLAPTTTFLEIKPQGNISDGSYTFTPTIIGDNIITFPNAGYEFGEPQFSTPQGLLIFSVFPMATWYLNVTFSASVTNAISVKWILYTADYDNYYTSLTEIETSETTLIDQTIPIRYIISNYVSSAIYLPNNPIFLIKVICVASDLTDNPTLTAYFDTTDPPYVVPVPRGDTGPTGIAGLKV